MAADVQRNNKFFRQLIFLGVLITIGFILVKQLNFFIGAFLGAIAMYMVLRNIMFDLVEKRHWRSWVASLFIVTTITVVLLGVGYMIYEVLAAQIRNVDASGLVDGVKGLVEKINDYTGYNLLNEETLSKSSTLFTDLFSSIMNTTYSFVANILMMIIILYFMLAHGRTMECKLYNYRPFHGRSWAMIRTESFNMIFSNVVGIPLVMIAQGLVAYMVYWIFGLNNAVFWAFITALCGLIPMIGTVIVSIPIGIYFISNGQVANGIMLMALGLFVIANVDNLVRIILLKKVAGTHPLIVIFGVIFGIPMFGFWGIIFGPLFLSGSLLLIKIYYHEFKLLAPPRAECASKEEANPSETVGGDTSAK